MDPSIIVGIVRCWIAASQHSSVQVDPTTAAKRGSRSEQDGCRSGGHAGGDVAGADAKNAGGYC